MSILQCGLRLLPPCGRGRYERGVNPISRAEHSPLPYKNSLRSAAALLLYFALAVFFFGRSMHWTTHFLGNGEDPISFIWFIHWWPFAVAHGLNPLISNYTWAPAGDNLAWKTSIPTAAFFGLPITILGGPILSYNLLCVSAPALSAFTAFLLARHLTRSWAAALPGGFFYGFSSYENGQMLGHLNLTLTFAIPLMILLCVLRVQQTLPRARFVVFLTLLFLIQLGLSTEILLTACLFGAIAWAIFLIAAPASEKPPLLHLAAETIGAGLLAIFGAAPFFYFIILGLRVTPDVFNTPAAFSADLLNYVLPTSVTRIGRTVFSPIAMAFTGNASEQGAYLGLPLLFLMALYFLEQHARRSVKVLVIMLVLLGIASLGPSLHVGGADLGIPLPWRLTTHLPFLGAALPGRFTLYISLISAIAVSAYIAAARSGRFRRYALAALAAVFLIPNPQAIAWTAWPAQAFFTPQNVANAIGPNRIVLIVPFSATGSGMAWQLQSGMAFRQAGGYTGFIPKQESSFSIVWELMTRSAWPSFANDLTAFCATHHVDDILIAPDAPPAIADAIAAMDWPQRSDHGVRVITVPAPSTLSYAYIQGDYWPSAVPQNWMGHQITIITHGAPARLDLAGTGFFATPVIMTRTSPAGRQSFPLGNGMTKTIQLPANSIETLTADKIFIPKRIMHSGDTRRLSVLVSLVPGPIPSSVRQPVP